VTDQQLLLAAIREMGLIIAEHLEPNGTTEARAIERLEQGHGLRVVK
jgi:hypothetical protein